ncbi:hypothetical protein GCM10022224_037020 [Nonomuraea antimicrobica]|uniref:Uncharacterized protein n=1 Tax=Nonomuraea antimicrobica TaxID=561173 RepID=A0ABP7BVN4_9ACTN
MTWATAWYSQLSQDSSTELSPLRFVGPDRAWGHRVYTSGMEWVAPPDAPDSQPCTAQCAMYGNRFEPVCTARRIEPAAWTEQRADERPIEPNGDDQRLGD